MRATPSKRPKKRTWLTPDLRAVLWAAWKKGLTLKQVASVIGIRWESVASELGRKRGIAPLHRRNPHALTADEREEISRGVARKLSVRAIARALGRSPSTVSRELRRNYGPGRYRATSAERRAWKQARRPKPNKLAHHPELRRAVEEKLGLWWSPRQVAEWLRRRFPGDRSMYVSHETIYRSLYVQARGALKAELAAHLRTGRARRKPRRANAVSTASIVDGISISARPPEVADRAVPGHWEGDLLFGGIHSYMATLVERSTRLCILVKVPSKDTLEVTAAIREQIMKLPQHLRRSLTWDRGSELSAHKAFSVVTDIPVYFADPHSPWQRGSNENTNKLLRQWFPKGEDVAFYSQADLDKYAALLNGRPRQTLGWQSPAEAFQELLP